MSDRKHADPTVDYIIRTFVKEPDYLKPVRAKGEELVPGMQLSPYEGHLLQFLVRAAGAKHVLEIGTFVGYSTLWMAAAPARVTSLEFKKEHVELARKHAKDSPFGAAVEVVEGDGLAWLQSQKPKQTYDFMFIDAEKKNYPNYLEAAMPLLKEGAWIVGDNTLLFGVMSGENPDGAGVEAKVGMQKFNEMLARLEGVLLPTPEGMSVAKLS